MSGVTGEGLPELLAALERVGAMVAPRPPYPATRLPVDRVFSLKGIGTVITGTLWSGSLSAEDTGGHPAAAERAAGSAGAREVRVRSVQVHDREVAGRRRPAGSLEPHRRRPGRGRPRTVGGQRPGHRAHLPGRRASACCCPTPPGRCPG